MSHFDSPNSCFLLGHVPAGVGGYAQARNSAVYSLIAHGVAAMLLMWIVAHAPTGLVPNAPATLPNVAWLGDPGFGGGGGGGGNRMPEPPRKIQLKGHEKVDVPAAPQPKPVPQETPALTQVTLPAMVSAASFAESVGVIAAPPTVPGISQGPGTDGGAGTDSGSGVGPNPGSGVGPGYQRGTGGDVYQPGVRGVSMPEVIYEKKPEYTSAALNAKVQGTVHVEAIVNPDGTVADARIIRSLDSRLGLDEKAIEAVRQWRFRPALKAGQPVAVRVLIELTFTLR